MKKLSCVLLFSLIACATMQAETAGREAAVAEIKGSVNASGAKGALAVGSKLGANSRIVTTPGSEVTLRFFDGTVAVVQPESELTIETLEATTDGGKTTKETTVLNLQKGAVVTTLDPAKKGVTEFRVKTPRGTAVAHGTVFAVRVTQDQANATLNTMSGTVTFVTDHGDITVAVGQVTSGSGVMTVSQAVAADPSLAQVLVQAATSVASAIGAGALGNSSQIDTVLAAVVAVAAEAAPAKAADIARSVLTAAAPALGANASTAEAVITQAAVQGVSKGDPALAATASTTIAAAVASAASSASLPVNPNLQAINVPTLTGQTEAPILPALDQTQIVVSPAR